MRIAISTTRRTPSTAGWVVHCVCPDHPELKTLSRELGTIGVYPLPPTKEEKHWADLPHKDLCQGEKVAQAIRGVATGDNPQAVAKVGAYLAAVLLGPDWKPFLDAADDFVDLELDFSQSPELHALPWEVMFWGGVPLAGLPDRVVSITRVVAPAPPAGAATAVRKPVALQRPVRVLFVVGRQLDAVLRPGAEILGVLRQLPFTVARGGLQIVGRGLHVRLLVEATAEEFTAALKEFKPHAVHAICHGKGSGSEARLLFTKKTGAGTADDPWASDDLLARFREADWWPPVVVLNACRTATSRADPEASDEHLSFAARLVAGGVPLAVGMSGEVEDATCQMFTRRFYRGLIERQPIRRAAAEARRAAVLHFSHYRDSLNAWVSGEWARPTLFQAHATNLEFAPDDTAAGIVAGVAAMIQEEDDAGVLCDRFDGLRWYQSLRDRVVNGGTCSILAVGDKVGTGVVGEPQVGKSRLLEELAAAAALDRLVPCLVRDSQGEEIPSNLLALAVCLANAMNKTREWYGLPQREVGNARSFAYQKFGIAHPDPAAPGYTARCIVARSELTDRLEGGAADVPIGYPKLKVDDVAALIQADIGQLLADVRTVVPDARAVLVLIDNFHRYEGVGELLLGKGGAFGRYGLGDAAAPAPVIVSYLSREKVGLDVEDVLKNRSGISKIEPIGKFEGTESGLAYRQSLRSRTPPLAVNTRADKLQQVAAFFETIHRMVDGWPSRLQDKEVNSFLNFASHGAIAILLPASDEDILNARVEQDRLHRASRSGGP